MACPFCERFMEAFPCGYSISNNVPEAGDGEIVIRLIGREIAIFRFRARLGGPQWSSSVTGTMEPNAVKVVFWKGAESSHLSAVIGRRNMAM